MYLNRETYVPYVPGPEGRGYIQHQQKEREEKQKTDERLGYTNTIMSF